jgi:hypothetical protein
VRTRPSMVGATQTDYNGELVRSVSFPVANHE